MEGEIFENPNPHKPWVSGPNPLVATFYYIHLLWSHTVKKCSKV
jgi:hypothetical protein